MVGVERGYNPEKEGKWLKLYEKFNIVTALIFLAAGFPVLAAIDAGQIILIEAYKRRKEKSAKK